jgi:hypothetical protein
VGYNVQRRNNINSPWGLATEKPLLAEAYSETSFVPPGGMYRVTALYADGRQGSTDFVYTNPPPFQVPGGFAATQVGAGQVRLTWQPVAFATGYRLFGPGQLPDGTIYTTTQVVFSNLPDGTYNWQVTADYGGAATGAGLPVAGITLATVASGRYLITITGLRAIAASADDKLSRDGRGDEVYVRTFVREYDRRNGGVEMFTNRGTLTYGDINGRGTSRVRAGTMSGAGGIKDGDPIPASSDPTERFGNPSDIAFPLRVWEGTLTNGVDVLVLSPTLWEEDGNTQPNLTWNQQMNDITPTLIQRPEIQNQLMTGMFAPILFGSSTVGGKGDAALAGDVAAAFLSLGGTVLNVAAEKLFSGEDDRPIGLIPAGVNEMVLPNQMVVLTREIIEAALAPLPPGTMPIGPPAWSRFPKPGVMMIPFQDGGHFGWLGSERPANYEMYLKVERLP